MDDITHLFAPIMVIGTILALIFAGGALWNSISRRRILSQSAMADEKEERIFFKPIPSSAPASQQEKPDNAAPDGTLPPLFRQMGASGVLSSEESADEEEDLYVWE